MTGGLQVLTLTSALRDGDFENFRPLAKGFLDQYREGGVVLVADRAGGFSPGVTSDAASLPPRNNREIVEKLFTEKKPLYSNLFVGAVKKRLIVTVEVPVLRDGRRHLRHLLQPADRVIQDIISTQRPSEDWTISPIFDGDGHNFARVPNPQETIGKRASPSLYAAIFHKSRQPCQSVCWKASH